MDNTITLDWQRDVMPYLHTMQSVEGGYTLAERGVVTIADGMKIFVKIAEGEVTRKWLKKEIIAYQRLNKAGYPYIPKLLAFSNNHSAMAIEYLEHASFENVWDKDKLDAVVTAQNELKKYKHVFTDDEDFTLESVIGLDSRWPVIMKEENIVKINRRFKQLEIDMIVSYDQLKSYEDILIGWSIADDTLVHQDIRADNFGYNIVNKTGKLVDWNWLCVGDESLDRTPLFVNMCVSGFDPYKFHPEDYDKQMLVYMISFWLERIMSGNPEENKLAFSRSHAQATSVKTSIELIENGPIIR